MRVELRGHGIEITEAMRHHAERALGFALDRFRERVERVRVSLRDVNGSARGGVDEECRVVVSLRPHGSVVARARRADGYGAIDAAVGSAARSLARAVERRRERVGKAAPGAAARPGPTPAAADGSAP